MLLPNRRRGLLPQGVRQYPLKIFFSSCPGSRCRHCHQLSSHFHASFRSLLKRPVLRRALPLREVTREVTTPRPLPSPRVHHTNSEPPPAAQALKSRQSFPLPRHSSPAKVFPLPWHSSPAKVFPLLAGQLREPLHPGGRRTHGRSVVIGGHGPSGQGTLGPNS